jgi:hypothetical protein
MKLNDDGNAYTQKRKEGPKSRADPKQGPGCRVGPSAHHNPRSGPTCVTLALGCYTTNIRIQNSPPHLYPSLRTAWLNRSGPDDALLNTQAENQLGTT